MRRATFEGVKVQPGRRILRPPGALIVRLSVGGPCGGVRLLQGTVKAGRYGEAVLLLVKNRCIFARESIFPPPCLGGVL